MRLWSIFLVGVSAVSISACSTFGQKADVGTPAPDTTAAATSASASEQEARELAAVMGTGDADAGAPERLDLTAAAPDAMPTGDAPQTAARPNYTSGVPDGCPVVEVLPDTRSITYFDNDDGRPVGNITARASFKEIRGGCDYEDNAVVVDIDMIMEGHITDKGRYEGRRDLEAFMTFPYFIAVMDPDGNMIDKKIMATAMRFKPNADDLDHAEKITQSIPLKDIGLGSHYTIATGFQLNRQQLDYNRGSVSEKSKAAPAKKSAPAKAPAAKTVSKKPDATPAPAPVAAPASGAKMTPIVD